MSVMNMPRQNEEQMIGTEVGREVEGREKRGEGEWGAGGAPLPTDFTFQSFWVGDPQSSVRTSLHLFQ